MSEVNLHAPDGDPAGYCRRLWGVLGTAAEPVVHYCIAVADGHPNPKTHTCSCAAMTNEAGARLICRYRERGAAACGRLITSVETTPIGEVSMPCGHPIRPPGKSVDRPDRRGAYGSKRGRNRISRHQ